MHNLLVEQELIADLPFTIKAFHSHCCVLDQLWLAYGFESLTLREPNEDINVLIWIRFDSTGTSWNKKKTRACGCEQFVSCYGRILLWLLPW